MMRYLQFVLLSILANDVAAVEEVKGGESHSPEIPGVEVYLDDLNHPALVPDANFTNSTIGGHMSIDFDDRSRSVGYSVGGVGGPGGGDDNGDGFPLGGSLPNNWVYWNRNVPHLQSFDQLMEEQEQVCFHPSWSCITHGCRVPKMVLRRTAG